MYRNYTRHDQVFASGALNTVVVHSGFLIDENQHPEVQRYKHAFEPFGTVAEFLEKRKDVPTHLVLIRMFALGDVLMLYTVCKVLLEQFPKLRITLLTSDRFVHVFDYVDASRFSVREYKGVWSTQGVDLGVSLNGCLEVDHSDLPVYKKHRINLYVEALGYR